MPTKGQLTRQRVVEQAAPVFNRRGYWGASLRDVMDATGLEKGGIYNHFDSKDDLALAAFEHNVELMAGRVRARLSGVHDAIDRLHALVDVYREFSVDPPFPGGCPILNAAVDSDDTHPRLRDRVAEAMDDLLHNTFERVLVRGLERGEVTPATDPISAATLLVSALEGSLMLTNLYDDPSYVHAAGQHLDRFIDSLAPEPKEQP